MNSRCSTAAAALLPRPPLLLLLPPLRCARCADLDCDGVITPSEMWHFYEEQMKRLEGLNQEPVLFEDVLCQLHDMLQVKDTSCCSCSITSTLLYHALIDAFGLDMVDLIEVFQRQHPSTSPTRSRAGVCSAVHHEQTCSRHTGSCCVQHHVGQFSPQFMVCTACLVGLTGTALYTCELLSAVPCAAAGAGGLLHTGGRASHAAAEQPAVQHHVQPAQVHGF